jgi:hypothetical protein
MTDPNETSDHIYTELCLARDAWTQLNHLRVKDEHRAILNGCANWFFMRVQVAFFREVILAISRLTDRPTTGKYENLSVARLLDDPRIDKHDGLRDELTAAVNAAETAADPVRPARDKVIAHFDRETKQLRSLNVPSDSQIETALGALENASRLHAQRVRNSSWSFEFVPMGDAKKLIDVLEQSPHWQTRKRLTERYTSADG